MKKSVLSVVVSLFILAPALAQVKQDVDLNDKREQAQDSPSRSSFFLTI